MNSEKYIVKFALNLKLKFVANMKHLLNIQIDFLAIINVIILRLDSRILAGSTEERRIYLHCAAAFSVLEMFRDDTLYKLDLQGSHASWKVLDFFLENSSTWKNILESHACIIFQVVQMEHKQQCNSIAPSLCRLLPN